MFGFLSNTLRAKAFKRSAAVASTFLSLNFSKLILTLFVPLMFVGCDEKVWDYGGNPSNLGEGYIVSFYGDGLDFLGAQNVIKGTSINLDAKGVEYGVRHWYLAENALPTARNFTPDRHINFYAVHDVVEISNQTGLNGIRSKLWDKYILVNDIELEVGDGFDETAGWLPIGNLSNPFSGIFSGNGYEISGLWINRTSDYVGLFGAVRYVIKNLGVLIDDSNGGIRGGQYVGGIAGDVGYQAAIINSYSTGSVSGDSSVGGIAGYVGLYSTIANSYSKANIHATTNAGGIAGFVRDNSVIINSYSTGDVSGTTSIGGIAGRVGYSPSGIIGSYAKGSVSGDENVGGIAGWVLYGSAIARNAAINQEINGTSNVNRIVGAIHDNNGTVANNFALNTINVNGAYKNSAGELDGVDKTSDELKTRTTYASGLGWFFGDNALHPWDIDEDEDYPYLYWED